MVSVYSCASAIIFFNLALIVVFILRRNTTFLMKHSTRSLLLLAALGIVRLLLPIDLPGAVIIPSETILPRIHSLMAEPLWGISAGRWLLLVWAAGALIVLTLRAREVTLDFRRRQRLAQGDARQAIMVGREFGLSEKNVVVSPDVTTPQVAGFFRTRIYLPQLELSDDELRWIFRHELLHVRLRDCWIKLFYLLLEALFWWNPVVHRFQKELDHLLELRCDERLTATLDDEGRREYLSAILSVVKQTSGRESLCSASMAGGDALQRFRFVLSQDEKKAGRMGVALMCGMSLCFLLSFFLILQPRSAPPAEDIYGAFLITSDNSYVTVDAAGNMKLYVNGSFFSELSYDELEELPYSELRIFETGD